MKQNYIGTGASKWASILLLVLFFLATLLFSQVAFPNFNSDRVLACGNWDHIPRLPRLNRSGPDFSGWTGGGGGGGTVSCSCSCNSCNPPSCPAGTSTTNTGDICYEGRYRRNCGYSCSPSGCGSASGCYSSYRSCWWVENDPAPTPPGEIEYQVRDISCNLGDEIRVPYPVFSSSSEGFLSTGSQNERGGDSIGNTPTLRYRYRILSLDSGYLSATTRYSPSTLQDLVSSGGTYVIYSRANSVDRCQGDTDSSEISRTFNVNHIPEVVSIEPAENPNDGVSGRYDMRDVDHGFDCVVDNPKTFRVVFEDGDGCGDIWEDSSSDTNVCGGAQESRLSLRAIDSVTGEVFAPQTESELSAPYDVSCEGNQITAYFDLTLLGDENADLTIQAKVDDIVGDSSDWQSGMDWLYDGIVPDVEIDSNVIAGADQVDVLWSTGDAIPTRAGVGLSGIRTVRISSRLTKGDVLQSDGSYSSIFYEGEEIMVNESFEEWVESFVASASYPDNLSDTNRVDIGRNQDGDLDFRIESVDRACNYAQTQDSLELGTPWIATRGGFVHSGTEIILPVKKSLYSQVLPELIEEGNEERTSLSTELVSVGNSISGFNFLGVEGHDFYSLAGYTKHPTLNHSWYGALYNRASTRDPEGSMWSEFTADGGNNVELSQNELTSNCVDNEHIYFINGNLSILTEEANYYESLAQGGADGCIFVVAGDLIISGGEYLSEGLDSPRYDFVRGFFLVDGVIEIEFVDRGKEVRDGLKVIGGLFSTGGSKSVKLGRSLQLKDNLQYPTLIIFHDARYLDISRELLGDTFGGGYIRDVGFIE